MAPVMDYERGYCDYECNLCGQVCPTGAIRDIGLDEKKLVQAGKVRLLEDKCVTHLKDQDCGACAEGCPTHAVYTVKRDGVHYPEVDVKLCTGCGTCENMCPEVPKAIVVDGLLEQGKAEEPFYNVEPTSVPKRQDDDWDFGF